MSYLTFEYAKSGRSACKGCKNKIDSDSLRVGIWSDTFGDYPSA